jgi:hypothetical protein
MISAREAGDRQLIHERTSSTSIRSVSIRVGYRPLRGLQSVFAAILGFRSQSLAAP